MVVFTRYNYVLWPCACNSNRLLADADKGVSDPGKDVRGKKKAQQHDLTETIFEKAKLFEYGTFIDIQ